MGCTSSIPDPNAMYGSEHKNITPSVKGGEHVNSDPVSDNKQRKDERNRHLRGDVSQYSEAKARREKRLRDTLLNREIMAKEMSDRVLEEKERLSLTSSRSRATSPRSGRPTARSIADIGFTSPSSSTVFANENDTCKNSHSKPPSENDTEHIHTIQNGGVKWQDQTEASPEQSPCKQRNGHVIPAIREDPDEGQDTRT